jgi:ABC-type bacteriocin/lantibiotic exporter with double-glycine peptidase domain
MLLELPADYLKKSWDVLALFLIPVGGGIPAGVILARDLGFGWPSMTLLYFISDVILAFLFEPILRLLRKIRRLDKFREAYAKMSQKTLVKDVTHKPWSLVMISFGIDPMTGRAAALAAGHNFISGWTIAILGDMIFFLVVMASTLWLDHYLGDGTWTAVIVTLAVLFLPGLLRKIKARIKR